MKDRKLATRYARALLATFQDPRQAELADQVLLSIAQAMSADEVRAVLLNPAVPSSFRRRVLTEAASRAGAPRQLGSFFETVVANGRTAELPAIAQAFHEEREREQGIVAATVSSAAPLPADLEAKVRATLERLVGRRVRMTVQVDPTLLGGVVSRIGSMVYDGSLRTQLETLRRRMVEE